MQTHQVFRGISLLCVILCLSSQVSFAQGGDAPENNCKATSCSCGGSISAGSCSSGRCCAPAVANCECNFYSSKCSCSNVPSTLSVPTIYEQNIIEMGNLLNSAAFTSNESKLIASKLPTLISAARNNDSLLYFSTADDLENLSKRLPPGEKQQVNDWVISKGGTILIE